MLHNDKKHLSEKQILDLDTLLQNNRMEELEKKVTEYTKQGIEDDLTHYYERCFEWRVLNYGGYFEMVK